MSVKFKAVGGSQIGKGRLQVRLKTKLIYYSLYCESVTIKKLVTNLT